MNPISIPPIAMATLVFYVGFYHFLIYRRQKKDRENLTFALCTGFSDIMTEEKAVAIGINSFLMKSIEMNHLCQKIRQLLDKKE